MWKRGSFSHTRHYKACFCNPSPRSYDIDIVGDGLQEPIANLITDQIFTLILAMTKEGGRCVPNIRLLITGLDPVIHAVKVATKTHSLQNAISAHGLPGHARQ